jgi:hypothetical protein
MKRLVLLLLLVAGCAQQEASETEARSQTGPYCESPRRIAALPAALSEASGVAISRRYPDILWAHNDSGEPILFAIDTLGKLRGRVRVDTGNNDWEDIAAAPCGSGNCLYIGATGDNRQQRSDRVIYRIAEPALDGAAQVDARFRYRLKDGPQDVEALFVLPGEKIFLITKGRRGGITLYAFPENPSTTEVSTLEPVQALTNGLVQLPDMVTAASASRDGKTVIIRSYSALQLYSFDGQLKPLLPVSGFDLQPLREQQGEGVDMTDEGVVYLVSEKGLADDAPPLSKVICHLSR